MRKVVLIILTFFIVISAFLRGTIIIVGVGNPGVSFYLTNGKKTTRLNSMSSLAFGWVSFEGVIEARCPGSDEKNRLLYVTTPGINFTFDVTRCRGA